MDQNDLYRAVGEIGDEILERSETAPKPRSWRRWGALAACLCLAVAAWSALRPKGGQSGHDAVQSIAALEFNGCYYEAVDLPDVLEKYGLPREITAGMAGEHVAYLQPDGGTGYTETARETDIELYTYAPSPCRGVYVLRDGETYAAALFCGLRQTDSNANCELTELYRIYGIGSAADLAAIAEVGWQDAVTGPEVTDRAALDAFYAITAALPSCGNDDFQAMTFGGVPEDEQAAAHTALADDRRTLRVETADGLRFFLAFYPEHGWLYAPGVLSYYPIDAPLRGWIGENLN